MQATDQVATAKIALPKTNSRQQPEGSVFSRKINFKPIAIASAPRIASYSVRLSLNAKKTNTDLYPKDRAIEN